MNQSCITTPRWHVAPLMAFVLFGSLSGAAFAGRDAGQLAMQDSADKAAAAQAAALAAARRMDEERRYLPLDHGPHAAATAWSNRRVLALRPDLTRTTYATAAAPKE